MTGITVTVEHLRALLEDGRALLVDPVNDLSLAVEGELTEAPENAIVITDYDLEHRLPDDWTDDDLAALLPDIQKKAGDVAADLAPPATHFTAWVTVAPDCLETDNADVMVYADDITQDLRYNSSGSSVWKTEYEMAGDPLFTAVTDVDVRTRDHQDAIDAATALIEAAGWRVTGTWEDAGTSYIAAVEPDEEIWTTDQVAQHMGIAPRSATTALRRLNVPALHREAATGQNCYSKTAVLHAHATRPGRGARTDLRDDQN